jgi:hypothetical protein
MESYILYKSLCVREIKQDIPVLGLFVMDIWRMYKHCEGIVGSLCFLGRSRGVENCFDTFKANRQWHFVYGCLKQSDKIKPTAYEKYRLKFGMLLDVLQVLYGVQHIPKLTYLRHFVVVVKSLNFFVYHKKPKKK